MPPEVPPPPNGNLRAVKHGFYATVRDPEIEGMIDEGVRVLREQCDWLQQTDEPLIRRYVELANFAEAAAQILLKIGIANVDEQRKRVNPQRLNEDYRGFVYAQTRVAAQLGLTPAARAALQLHVAAKQTLDLDDMRDATDVEPAGDQPARDE
jgi:phage terminase small subunit